MPRPRTPSPRRLRRVLDPALFDSFRLYVRALAETDQMHWEDWGRRRVRHNDPVTALIHRDLTGKIAAALRRAIKPSYSFLACYGDGGTLPAHRDREQCRYTLDLCLEPGQPRAWPLYVGGRPYTLRPNEGLLYYGCDLTHHRREKPPGPVHVALFHFVDADFEGDLD